MNPSFSSETSRPFLARSQIIEWAEEHYRYRVFSKDERIPTRPGLIYIVERGAVRLVVTSPENTSSETVESSFVEFQYPKVNPKAHPNTERSGKTEEAFLGFIGAGQPFEVVSQSSFIIQAYAHIDQTAVVWMYWDDLDRWLDFRTEVLDAFRYHHQRKLMWLGILGQRRTIDRLLGFLTLLISEYGQPSLSVREPKVLCGYCLPWSLTHAQIGSAIGSTRVTVTRLMGKLRAAGLIRIREDNSICLPPNVVEKNNHESS